MSPKHHKQEQCTLSVVIVTRDRPVLLNRSLTSLTTQTIKPMEVIIIDSSTYWDAVHKVINVWTRQLPLNVHRTTKQAIPDKRDLGVKLSHGNIIVFLDDDISAERSYLARIHTHFMNNPGLTAVMGRVTNAYGENVYASTYFAYYTRGLQRYFPRLNQAQPLPNGRLLDCAVLGIRASVIRRTGFPHRSDGYRQDDVELGIRLIQSGKNILFDPDIVGVAAPRNKLLEMVSVAFREGYWGAFVEKRYHISLDDTPNKPTVLPWLWKEVKSKKSYPTDKKIWYSMQLFLYPTVVRIGKICYNVHPVSA